MKNILIIGAGRSSNALIQYVLANARDHNWMITVADKDPAHVEAKIGNHPNARVAWLDVTKPNDRKDLIKRADVVVSLVPAFLHIKIARDCIKLRKLLITASYISAEMYEMSELVRDNALNFMGEMVLDPGIDHMSAKQQIDQIQDAGGKIVSFKTYGGGLISKEHATNPWRYKFTWNPRNVVLSGHGTAQYLQKGKHKYIPYQQIFKRYQLVDIQGFGQMEAYPNRDSLLYRNIYQLEDTPNILRATLRYPGFCDAWNALVQLGLTDATFPILELKSLSYLELLDAFVKDNGATIKERVAKTIGENVNSEVMEKLEWLGLFSKKKIKLHQATPAMILEDLLLQKWTLEKEDKDVVLLQHEIEYRLHSKSHLRKSTMILKGENRDNTAMSKVVGLPVGIFVKMVMTGKIRTSGVQIPVTPEVYQPVLKELSELGIVFTEKTTHL